ncbi:hypothetical protein [Nonomuraea glycinis]|nr:hypothetical protein [Nonomuraea glycinis]
MNTDKGGRTFKQRVWYLPTSQILIADDWNVSGLAGIVERATWK